MSRENDLAYWINTREYIRIYKEAGSPKPWTSDSILQRYRFCNVRREDDKVTRWIRRNWSYRYGGQHPSIVLATVMARFVNRIESLEYLGYPDHQGPDGFYFSSDWFYEKAESAPKPFWGNAYTISTCGAKMPKALYVGKLLHRLRDCLPCHTHGGLGTLYLDGTLDDAHRKLTKIYGIGSFLAAQVVADLKNTPDHPLETARDRATWAAPGPGSRRGLDRFYGLRMGTVGWLGALQRAAERTQPFIDRYLWVNNLEKMDMQDWQNCMCEFDKYLRLKEDGGHVRNTYPGTSA